MDTTLTLAVQNLEVISKVLESKAAEDKNYNTDFGYYLDQMSYTMRKNAAELKVLNSYLTGQI